MAGYDGPPPPRRSRPPDPGGHDPTAARAGREPGGDRFSGGAHAAPSRARSSSGGRTGSGERPRHRRNILWRFRRVFFLLALVLMAFVAVGAAWISRLELTDPEELRQSSYICAGGLDARGCTGDNAMAKLSSEGDHSFVALDEMPAHVTEAVIAAEDRGFYEHDGVSPRGIVRAAYQSLRGSSLQGGSTITQQYVKNAFLTDDRTYDRKLREAVLAMKLEREWSKDQILEAYLNTIYLGRNSRGVQAASRTYFDKDVQALTLPEATYLAGLIRAPEVADVDEDPDEARRRRTTVLDAMLEEGYITQEEYDAADADQFESVVEFDRYQQIETMRGEGAGTEYVTQYVRQRLQQEPFNYSEEEISGGGLRVYTTLDMELQQAAHDTIYHPENGILNQEGDPDAAVVTLDGQGRILTMVGGRNYDDFQVNLATSGRPVGSTFKPLALAAAVQDGYSLLNTEYNSPASVELGQIENCDPWEVDNYSDTDHEGALNLVEATAASSNTAYAQLMEDLTPSRVQQMATDLGMDSELGECLPTVLGSDNSPPLEMAEVFSVFANRGVHHEPRIITRVERVDAEGDVAVEWEGQPEQTRVMTAAKSDLVTHALREVVATGTGTAAQIPDVPVAGKTGTTSDNKDAWFMGYAPGLTTAVWMGYPRPDWVDPQCDPDAPDEPEGCRVTAPMNQRGRPVRGQDVTGGSFPAQIWQTYMSQAVGIRGVDGEFVEPSEEQLRAGLSVTPSTTAPPTTRPPATRPSPSTTEPGDDDDDDDRPRPTQPTITIGPPPTVTPPSTSDTTEPTTSTTLPCDQNHPDWPWCGSGGGDGQAPE